TVIPVNAPMQLIYVFTSRRLMQAVYILGHYRSQLSRLLQLCQLQMRRIRLRIQYHHLFFIEFVKSLRVLHEEAVAHHLLRRLLLLLMIKSNRTAEVRNITLSRHSCAAKKNDPAAVVYDLLKLFCLFLIHSFPPPSIFQKSSFFNMPVENLLHLLPDDF